MDSDKDKNQCRSNERDNDRYTERHIHCPGPPAGGAEEMEQLRMKAEIYRNDFINEHKMRHQAEAKVKELQAKLEEAEKQEEAYKSQLDEVQDNLEMEKEEKDSILRMMRKLKREVDLYKEQTDYLQERLRDLEAERRDLRFSHSMPGNDPRQAPAWPCPRCTYSNAPMVTRCEMCEEPKPVAASSALDLGRIVCDNPWQPDD